MTDLRRTESEPAVTAERDDWWAAYTWWPASPGGGPRGRRVYRGVLYNGTRRAWECAHDDHTGPSPARKCSADELARRRRQGERPPTPTALLCDYCTDEIRPVLRHDGSADRLYQHLVLMHTAEMAEVEVRSLMVPKLADTWRVPALPLPDPGQEPIADHTAFEAGSNLQRE